MNKITISALFLAIGSGSAFATVLFDGTYDYDNYSASNEVGELFTLAGNNATLTSASLIYFVPAPVTYSDLQLEVTYFGSGQTSDTGIGNEFSDPLTTVLYDYGALNNYSGAYEVPLALPTPIKLSGNMVGAQFTWLDESGGVVSPAYGIGTVFSLSPYLGPSIGSNGLSQDGYNLFELASYATDSSTPLAQSTNLYYWGENPFANIAVTLNGTLPTPEPSSFAFLGLGVVGLFIGQRRNRKS